MNPLPGREAAVIGIDAYGQGIAPLKSAVADARALARTLASDHGYAVPDVLLDAEATGTRLLRLLEEDLPARIRPESALVIYFAGHGIARGDGSEGPEGFLLPQDAHPADETSWLAMRRVRQALARLPCRHLLVVLDCCFAGSFRWAASRNFVPVGRPLFDSQFDRYLLGTAWQVLTSASHDELASDVLPGAHNHRDTDNTSHSPFAAALLRGLAGEADSSRGCHEPDGVMTATELYQYVFEELVPPGTEPRQTPGLWPLRPENTGEFVFLSPLQEKRTRPDPPLDDAHNPWRGLAAYGEDDASLFFGRERLARELAGLLGEKSRTPLVAVVGASGTGKSSLVRGALLPLLQADSPAWTVIAAPRLEGDPRAQLAEVERRLAEAQETPRKLIVFDPFEELFTRCPDATARDDFLKRLRELLERTDVQVVLTLRSDFESRLKASALGDLLSAGRFLLPPLGVEELREMIEKPAAAQALYFEPEDLVDELIDEVTAMPGALPLLSFALAETYRQAQLRRRETGATDRALKRQDYEAAGGVTGALHRRADELFTESPGSQAVFRLVALRMVSIQGGRLTRRRVSRRELQFAEPREQETADEVVRKLTDARLVVADEGHVEPAHDTLVRAWPRLTAWLAEAADVQAVLRALWPAAEAWDQGKRDAGLLWDKDPRLPQVLGMHGELNRLEQEFVAASRRRKRRGRVVRTAVLAAILGLVVGTLLYRFWAKRNREEALNQRLAAQVRVHQEQRLDLALLLSLELEHRSGGLEAHQLLFTGLESSPRLERIFYGQDEVRAVAWSADGRLASGGADATVRIWEQASLDGPGAVWSLAWSGDGRRLAAGGEDGLRVWETAGSSFETRELMAGTTVYAVAWSRDGRILAAAHDDYDVRLWDVGQGRVVATLTGGTDWVTTVAWSADGQAVAAAGMDKQVRRWTADGAPLGAPLSGHAEGVTSLAWNGDGTLASGSLDGTVVLWDPETGQSLGRPLTLSEPVGSVAWNDEGDRLAVGGVDGRIAVWDLAQDPPRPSWLTGISGALRSLAWSADGRTLASGNGGAVVLWSIGDTVPLGGTRGGYTSRLGERVELGAAEVRCLALSGDGTLLAAEGRDPVSRELTLRVWDLGDHVTPRGVPVRGLRRRTGALTWSADGSTLLGVERDGTIRRWDAATGELLSETRLAGDTLRLSSPAWSADATRLAARRRDGTVGLWDATTGASLSEPPLDEVTALVWNAGGDVLAAAGHDLTVRFWEVDSGRPEGEALNVPSVVTVLAWSRDGATLATGGADRRILLWDVESRTLLAGPFAGHADTLTGLAFTPDGTTLLSLGMDGTLLRWDVDPQSWKKRACRIVQRDLTPEEWKRFFPGSPYRLTCPPGR